MKELLKKDFYFDLPPELIAQDPLEKWVHESSKKEDAITSYGHSKTSALRVRGDTFSRSLHCTKKNVFRELAF